MLLHVVGELGELLRGDAQSLGGVGAHGGDDFVVEVLDEFGDFFLEAFGGIADGLAHTGRRLFHLAVEVGHDAPHENAAWMDSRDVADARLDYYFAGRERGQWRTQIVEQGASVLDRLKLHLGLAPCGKDFILGKVRICRR